MAECNGQPLLQAEVLALLPQPGDGGSQAAAWQAALDVALDGAVAWQALGPADQQRVAAQVAQEEAHQQQLHGTRQNWLANLRQHGQSLAAWQLAVRTDRALDALNRAAIDAPIDATAAAERWAKTRGRFVHSAQVLLSELVVPHGSGDGEKVLAAAQDRLAGGQPFATVAVALSQVPSARSGGDRGWTGLDRLDPRLANAVAGLQPGQVSTAVRTDFGWHLLQLRDRRPAQMLDWPQAQPLVEAQLRQERAFVLRRHRLADLRNSARVHLAPPSVR
ncbi:MAG: peptidylprolyl isomerase [Deltaproteobacteria bacterium]|nr:peptidylprolyl isomerase [Deltaproteobacteria bacterium]